MLQSVIEEMAPFKILIFDQNVGMTTKIYNGELRCNSLTRYLILLQFHAGVLRYNTIWIEMMQLMNFQLQQNSKSQQNFQTSVGPVRESTKISPNCLFTQHLQSFPRTSLCHVLRTEKGTRRIYKQEQQTTVYFYT